MSPQEQHIRRELSRYMSGRQLEERTADRLIECTAKKLNPLEWAYLENTERINFKTASYFRWEKVYVSNRNSNRAT